MNGKRKRGWIIPLSVAFLFFGGVIPAMAGFIEKGSETLLKNGLKVIWIEDRRAPVVTFQVWYRAGARHDPWGRSGLAHVLEHMMFKGTEKIGADEFTRTIRENGGQYNAFTSYDFSGYFETLSSDRVRIAIELEADRMRNLVLREEDFQTERLVVMEERRLRIENDPQAVLREQVDAVAFLTQPYSRPVIGWMEDLARINMEDVRLFYERYYHPANAFLVVVGDFEKETLLQELEKSFGAIPGGVKPEHHRFQDPPQEGERRLEVRKEAQLPALRMAYPVPNLLEKDGYVLAVIASILAGGESSRFQERLVREKRLAMRADAEYSLLTYDPALFYLSADPLPERKLEEVEEAIHEELQRLKEEPVGERELEKAKNQHEAEFVYSQDSLFFQAMLVARFEIVSDWKEIQEYLPSIRQVTSADIQRVAKRYFVRKNRTAGMLIPLTETGPDAAPEEPKQDGEGGENR